MRGIGPIRDRRRLETPAATFTRRQGNVSLKPALRKGNDTMSIMVIRLPFYGFARRITADCIKCKLGRPSSGSADKSFLSARTPAASEKTASEVPSLMGKQSWKERPPRLWPCEKGLLAAFEPRNASPRTPRGLLRGLAAVIQGVTAGRDRHSEPPAIPLGAFDEEAALSEHSSLDVRVNVDGRPAPWIAESGGRPFEEMLDGLAGSARGRR